MNIIIGRIYEAPWGRYVGHREGVLRSLDSFTAFSIQPHPDDYIDTGEDLDEPQPQGTRAAVVARHEGMEAPDGRGRDERIAPLRDAGSAGAQGPGGTQEALLVHERQEESGLQPQAPVVPVQRVVSLPPHTGRNEGAQVLTLGGLRPGSVYCIVPGRPQLEWTPCLTRDEAKAGPHLWYLASTDEASLYCPRCRPHDAESFVELAAAVAAGKGAEVFTDHPFARMVLRISVKTTRAKRWAQTGPEGDGGPALAPEAVIGSERPAVGVTAGETAIERQEVPGVTAGETAPTGTQYTAHCCPRIVLGHGLHSPQCANYVGEGSGLTAPSPAATDAVPSRPARSDATTLPALERDDPKAEAGSFEVEYWRPRYRDRADYDEWFTERAAICEYLGGMRRELADRAALKLAGAPP